MKPTLITYNGKTQSITAWSKEYKIPLDRLSYRLQRGWDFKKAITEPPLTITVQRWEYNGKMYTAEEMAMLHGDIGTAAMRRRLQTMSVEKAISLPNRKPHRKERITEEGQKKKFKPKQDKPDTTQCRTCQYRLKDLSCGYAIVERRCRMFISKRSPNCTVYIKGKSIVQEAVRRQMGKVRL